MVRDGRAGAIGRTSIPGLRRSLAAAGVPVEVASDETPLVREPAVLPLLGALAVVVDGDIDDPADESYVDADRAEALLTSPLGGLDATDVRSLTRALRARDRSAPARDLVRSSVLEPAVLEGLEGEPGPSRPPARRAARPGPGRAGRGRHRRGGAVGVLGRRRLGPSTPRCDPDRWAVCAAGSPRPRRHLCTLRGSRAGRGAEGPHERARVPGHPARPGDPGRHPCRPGRPRGSGAAAPPTGPRAWSGDSSSWPMSRRAPGPTSVAATRCCRLIASARTGCSRRSRARRCSPRNAGCSTSRPRGPGSGSS